MTWMLTKDRYEDSEEDEEAVSDEDEDEFDDEGLPEGENGVEGKLINLVQSPGWIGSRPNPSSLYPSVGFVHRLC